ncbi:hypothetical protein HAX54_048844 [Datura stramonium]|uniref:Uncharacterized protein n=1 Tax=Datura stramonium TaxID=4076 RepID=A0ABS8SUR4_DATST|nr:hypothetical protein [Datura stramonium]
MQKLWLTDERNMEKEEERNAMLVKLMTQIGLIAIGMRGSLWDVKALSKVYGIPVMRIKILEGRMNDLDSEMRSEMSMKEKEPLIKNITPSQRNIDDEDMEQNIEEILFKELLDDILLNNIVKSIEGLEETWHAIVGVGSYHYQPKNLDPDLKN